MQGSSYLRQPRKPSGKINQKLNQKDPTIENQSDGGIGITGDPEVEAEGQEPEVDFVEDPGTLRNSPRFNDDEERKSAESLTDDDVIKPTALSRRRFQKNSDEARKD